MSRPTLFARMILTMFALFASPALATAPTNYVFANLAIDPDDLDRDVLTYGVYERGKWRCYAQVLRYMRDGHATIREIRVVDEIPLAARMCPR